MARITYDEQTAAAFKAVREVPRDGLWEWREAVRRHLRPSRGMTLVDIGVRAPYRCQMHRQTPHGSPMSFSTSQTWVSPHTRSAAFSAPVPPSSSEPA